MTMFLVAIGDGFSGDVLHLSAKDEADAREMAEQDIAKMSNTEWRVLNVKPAGSRR